MAKNDITGDDIKTGAASKAYVDNYDRIFGKNKLTYKEQIAAACYDIVGSMHMGNELELCLESVLGRKANDADMIAAEDFMKEEGIQECGSCGWWHCSGDLLCDECLENLEEIELEDD